MCKRILLLLLCCWTISGFASNIPTLSNSAKIYLWTYDPIVDLYGSYGHDALFVKDAENDIFYIYNYGTFNFNTEGFYLKFAQGRLDYELSVIRCKNTRMYQAILMRLEALGKTIKQNEMLLDSTQRQAVFDFLETNALPENKKYQYDFFFDNCATRVRDMLVEIIGEDLDFGIPEIEQPQTFRDMHKTFMYGRQWAEFGIDFLLGAKSDRIATPEERMYIPIEMYRTFKVSTIENNGKKEPLIGVDETVVQSPPLDLKDNLWTSPLAVFWAIFGLVLLYSIRTWKKDNHRLDKVLFIFFGLIGLLIFLMWFATDHRVMVNNWNLLWLQPLHLVAGFALFSKKARESWLKNYFRAIFFITTLTLAGWLIIPQYFHPAFMPMMLMIILRSYRKQLRL